MSIVAAVAAIVGGPAAASAGGLYVPGVGPQAQARAGAFTAKADDPSALYHNPAGFAKLRGTVILIGANLVDYDVTFRRAGTYEDPDADYFGEPYPTVRDQSRPALGLGGFQAIPLIAVSTDLGLELPVRFGFGLMAPQGFPERNFSPDYQFEEPGVPPPPQRYDVVSQEAATVMPSVAVAYRVTPDLDVGVRGTWGIASVKAKSYVWGVRNYEEAIDHDGVFTVDATDNFVPSLGAGALYRPSPAFEIGLSYHSKMTIKGRGHGTSVLGSGLGLGDEQEFIEPENEFWECAPGGTLDRLKACITVPLPQMATVGARYILRDGAGDERADVELDVRWENWSAASDYHVIVDGKSGLTGLPLNESFIRHGLKDVISVRLGGSYTHAMGGHRIVGRAGVAHDTAAAPASWQRLDFDGAARTTLAAGVGYQGRFYRLDVGGGLVLQPDRTVEHCNPSVAQPGCETPGQETPVRDRTQPDPVQPLQGPFNQVQSPFNGGEYSSGYVLLSLGFTAWF